MKNMKLKMLNEKDSFALNLQRDEVLDESAGHVILKGAHAIDKKGKVYYCDILNKEMSYIADDIINFFTNLRS